MQICKESEISKNSLFKTTLIENRYFFILLAFLIIGMLFGSISVGIINDKYSSFIDKWVISFIGYRATAGYFSILIKAIGLCLLYLFAVSVSGFGVSGIVLLPLILLVRGIGTSAVAGVLYKGYSLQGITFANLILLPSCLITDFVLLFIGSRAMELSSVFLQFIRDISSRGIDAKPQYTGFLRCLLKCLPALLASALIEATFSVCFTRYFSFF